MKHWNEVLIGGGIACLAVGLLLSGCKKKTSEVRPLGLREGADEIVARVGDREITAFDLTKTAHSYSQFLLQQGQRPPPDFENNILDIMIESELLYQSGRDLAVPDLKEKVDAMYQELVARFPSETAFAEALSRDNLTPDLLREDLKKDLMVKEVLERNVYSQVTVGEDELEAYYQEHRSEMEQPELRRARHILVRVPETATEEEKKAAREKALALKKRIDGGEDFAAVAQESSECPSKEKGGELGFFPQEGVMDPDFVKGTWSLSTGVLSEPVETKFGYHLIEVEEIKPAGIPPLEEVKARISEILKNKKSYEKLQEYLNQVREQVKVEKLKQRPQLPLPAVQDSVPPVPEPALSPPPPEPGFTPAAS